VNISLTEKQQNYIAAQRSGDGFQNASEVVPDTLGLDELYLNRVAEELRQEIAKGWNGPASARSVGDIIKAKARKRKE